MRRWTIEVAGRRFDVEARPDGDAWVVQFSRRPLRVRLDALGAGHGHASWDGKTVAFGWTARESGYAIALEGSQLEVAVGSPGMGTGAGGPCGPGAGPVTVAAPLPGKVRGVLAKEGETVERGAALLLLDAMKLENEIQAPVRGVVESIHVKPGDSVEHGQRLVVLRPA